MRLDELIDFEQKATGSVAGVWRVLAWTLSLGLLVVRLRSIVIPISSHHEATALGSDSYEGFRYGVPLEKRRAIFAELAATEIAERQRAIEKNTWGGHAWSREDDRGHREMTRARQLAAREKLSLSQIYLVLDEGIRAGWLGPDGHPLLPTTPPQDPRSTW